MSPQYLLSNVHEGLPSPGDVVTLVKGSYHYYHYGCDGFDDRGWGCGYRTLQTLCSWVKGQMSVKGQGQIAEVPSLPEIQKTLMKIGDKGQDFVDSKQWIGSVEVCLCLDTLYDVPSKILHITSGDDLASHISTLVKHFDQMGSPVMMGGSTDNSSKGILGVCQDPASLLVLDPHFYGPLKSVETLCTENWIKWRTVDTFNEDSFYNLCLPQLKSASCS
ncbi:ufm1-specific protease 1-like [Liolophura sinensis]|uniref:ufm1-specific protease 1-like n=1 Tax=Liolophura sinensis TaxID=3198878 RepID=UPI0031594654